MTLRLLRGDMRVTLAGVEPGSVQTCITSPPYYGLRSYSTPPLVWGAWLGHLGLEPHPDLFVEHIVECFRAVKRVLRDDGTIWVNMGDSYAGSGKGPTGYNGIGGPGNQERRQGFSAGYEMANGETSRGGRKSKTDAPAGFKAKDLMMMPARVAMALQADGWWLRSMIPWLKRNAMPESVTDRPATSVEYVFLLSKSARYFYDADAVRGKAIHEGRLVKASGGGARNGNAADDVNDRRTAAGSTTHDTLVTSRNRRNGDWFFESWQGLLLDDGDDPLALVVNPAPYKDAHYATFPPKLVEPMIKASTSERGCCAECGAPWARITDYQRRGLPDRLNPKHEDMRNAASGGGLMTTGLSQPGWRTRESASVKTTGWRPSCKHAGEPVPQIVLDPFAGANTTLLVADRLGRNGLGCELSESYSDMGSARLVGDAPMFVELESA